MQKLMIIGGDILGETLKGVLADYFDEVIIVDRKQALETFFIEDPNHVLISDTLGSPGDAQVVKDIRGANVSSRIVCYGFGGNVDIKFPIKKEELISVLMGEKE